MNELDKVEGNEVSADDRSNTASYNQDLKDMMFARGGSPRSHGCSSDSSLSRRSYTMRDRKTSCEKAYQRVLLK